MEEFLRIIEDKRLGKEHSTRDITWVINNLEGLPENQVAAWLMAVCINGLSDKETTELTRCMAYSGHVLTLQRHRPEEEMEKTQTKYYGFVDKHSTGGVGDKVSLVLSPILASLGFQVSKFSGRSLGHTGGTIDKLETIPGFQTDITIKQFEKQIDEIGLALASQTMDFAPADKKLYALRDKTGTVQSIPLIASSVMSKKIAGGADIIILDVKVGSGAFMKSLDDAKKLAKTMKKIGDSLNLQVKVFITNMEEPLGNTVGNSLEVLEAINTLKGEVKNDFYDLVIELACSIADKKDVEEAITSGRAYEKFLEFVNAQGGNVEDFYSSVECHNGSNPIHSIEAVATEDGYVKELDALKIGQIIHELGYSPALDNHAGISLVAKVGDRVKEGDPIFRLQGRDQNRLDEIKDQIWDAYLFSKSRVKKPNLVLKKYL